MKYSFNELSQGQDALFLFKYLIAYLASIMFLGALSS